MKTAIITPYCNESLLKLERCHFSVKNQTEECTHFLVADGQPIAAVNDWECRHIVLGQSHHDNGNTPRGVGSLCAMNEGFELICFLDADNWYSKDHITSVLYCQAVNGSQVVFSDRFVVFPDGEILTCEDPEDANRTHVDTSCMAIFSPAFKSLASWCDMPQMISPWCDRVVFSLLVSGFDCAWTEYKSVYFETWYHGHFVLAGRDVPRDAKSLKPLSANILAPLNQLYNERSYNPCLLIEGEASVKPSELGANRCLAFIMGPMRSGTTILQATLASNPQVLTFPEHQFFHWFSAFYGSTPFKRVLGERLIRDFSSIGQSKPSTMWWKDHVFDISIVIEKAVEYDAASAFSQIVHYYQVWREADCANVILDKTLSNSLCADFVLNCFPEAKVILSLRDPIDVFSSIRAISLNQPSTWKEQWKPIEYLLEEYILSLLRPLRVAESRSLFVVRHERFLCEPEDSLSLLSSFLGIDANPFGCLSNSRSMGYFIRPDEIWKTEAVEAPIRRAPHAYANPNLVSCKEAEYVYAVLGKFLASAGYSSLRYQEYLSLTQASFENPGPRPVEMNPGLDTWFTSRLVEMVDELSERLSSHFRDSRNLFI